MHSEGDENEELHCLMRNTGDVYGLVRLHRFALPSSFDEHARHYDEIIGVLLLRRLENTRNLVRTAIITKRHLKTISIAFTVVEGRVTKSDIDANNDILSDELLVPPPPPFIP